ncbi:MAG TPA: O-antigen ligase family protein, partial [Thermoleophilia bacterium]|nr:O-antigen ligase family protein [Thermoleophilia bacterium]
LEVLGQRVNLQAAAAAGMILVSGIAVAARPARLAKAKTVAVFGAWAVLGVAVSPSSAGVNELLRLLSGIAFYFLAGSVLSRESSFETFALLFIPSVSVPIGISFLQWGRVVPYEYWDWIGGGPVGRATGSYPHPLGLVYYLVVLVPLVLVLVHGSRSRWDRAPLVLYLGEVLVALFMTLHRVGIFAIGAGMTAWLVLSRRLRIAILLLVAAVLAGVMFREWLALYLSNLLELLRGDVSLCSERLLRGRGQIWCAFLDAFRTSPPLYQLIGHGASVIGVVMSDASYVEWNEPHNDFIRILYSHGAIALLLYIVILGRMLASGFRLRIRGSPFEKRLGTLGIVVVFSLSILSVTTEPLRYPTASWYLFAIGSAMAVAARRSDIRSASLPQVESSGGERLPGGGPGT